MDSRERVRLALSCRQPDRIPIAFGFFAQSPWDVADVDEHFGSDVRYVEFNPPPGQDDFLRYLRGLPEDVHVGSHAQIRTYHEWNYHPELASDRPLGDLHDVADLAEHVFPDLTHPDRHAGLAEWVARWHDRGLAVAGGSPHLGGELFETAWRLRGFENFMIDLASRKSLAHYLLDQLTAMVAHSALVLAQAGVDVLLLDDDVATPTEMMIGPGTWREFFKGRLSRVIALAREAAPDLLVFYHSDGNFTGIVPDLVEIGVNVINPVQPDCMDALAVKRAFGDRLALWGTVGSASLWDHGTPDQIRAEVRRRAAALGPAGLLLAPAYDLDYTPRENVTAFVEAVQEYEWATRGP